MSNDAEQVKLNMENIKNEISLLLSHKEVLTGLIEKCKSVFESKIVIPKRTVNLSTIGKSDIAIDMVPAGMATKEQLEARHAFYHYSRELADIIVAIEAKKNLYYQYQDHLKQYFNKQSKPMTDEMIYDKLTKAQSLKDMSPEEKATLDGIIAELPKRLNSGKDARIELYEALQNLILQHG